MDPFIGQIQLFGFNFAPAGWAKCNGQLLSIAQNTALFSLLGTIYGGDGETTFGLPDLRGRSAIHNGSGPGLSNFIIGQRAGQQTHTLNTNQMPSHSHNRGISSASGEEDSPVNNVVATHTAAFNEDASAQVASSSAGNNQPFNLRDPYLVVNFCIALVGIFPTQS